MIKKVALVLAVMLAAAPGLLAKTIWIEDVTSDAFATYYNAIKEDIKESKYAPYCRYVTNNNMIRSSPGDLVVEISGLDNGQCGLDATIIMCNITNDLSWAYKTNYLCAFTEEYTFEQARETKKQMLKFFSEYF